MRVPDSMIWALIGCLSGICLGVLLGLAVARTTPSTIAKSCSDRMYFIADDGMYLCKRHEPFK